MVWFLPRGLITAVLGIQIVEARGAEFDFSSVAGIRRHSDHNLAMLIGSLRARKLFPGPTPAMPEPAVPQMET
jgi:hypothetical protein